MQFEEIVPDPDQIMGVKAVFGVLASRVMCFASRGDRLTEPNRHYQAARSTAEKAMQRRWLVSIGGGKDCPPELLHRVLNVASVSSTFGETEAFVEDAQEKARLAQWPTAVALRDVFEIEGFPHVTSDLGFPDLRLLTNAFDQVVRPEAQVVQLWTALQHRQVSLSNLPPLIGFYDSDKLIQVGSILPANVSSLEGRRLKKEAADRERDPALAKAAKDENRARHGGKLVCEGCEFTDSDDALFDAHHLVPLSLDVRQTVPADLAVVCPTCHRVCHRRGTGPANPLPIAELREWWHSRSASGLTLT